MDGLENLLPRLVSRTQWMAWRRVERNGGKFSKQPINPHNGGAGKHNDPTTWGSLAEALALRADGIGFTLSGDDPFCILDIDGAIDEDGALTELAGRVLDRFRGAYVELSPSGRGLHIIIEGKLPGKGRNSQKLGLEVYDRLRFVTVTGECFGESGTVEPMQEALDWLLAEFWPETPKSEHKGVSQAAQGGRLIDDDYGLLGLIRSSKRGAKFDRLWDGDWQGLGYASQSDADLALCGMFEFWTQGDAARIDQLFRQSGLMRGKWDELHGAATYGAMTVEKALAGSTGHYSGRGGGAATAAAVNTRRGGKEQPAPQRVTIPAAERSPDPDTERANAERLAEHHGHELRYAPGLGWLYYDGRRWAGDERQAKRLAAGVTRYVEQEIIELARLAAQAKNEQEAKPYVDAMKALRKWRRRCGMFNTVSGTLGLSDKLLELDPGDLDTHDHLLNLANGTLDLETGNLRAHSPADLITQIAPVAYEPEARCPTWERVVSEVMPDVDTRSELRKLIGYCLSGYISEQVMAFLFGAGSNGKSLIASTVAKVLGENYATRAAPGLLMASNVDKHTTDRAALRGARLVVASESEQERRFAVQTLKELTGETQMTARLMRQDNATFPIRFKIVLMANHKPDVSDMTHSFWRRLLMFPFTVQFGVNKALEGQLGEELPGILNWCLAGYRLWRAEGLGETAAMAALKGEYREEEDEGRRFLSDRFVLEPGAATPVSELWLSYTGWCLVQGSKPMKQKGFNDAMKTVGLEYRRTKSERAWAGIRLKEREEL
jgi:putative DNA primase/helicase